MQTTKRTFNDFLSGSDKQLYCPPLQRPYEWGEQQWHDFYEDLKSATDSGDSHFFGTLILTPGIKEGEVTRHMLIDGQQRLTTLTLLLARGERELGAREDVSEDHEYVHGSIRRVLRNKSKDVTLAWRVWPTAADQADFNTAMSRGIPPKGSRFGKACQWFDTKFKSREEFPTADSLARFLERVLDSGVAVSIEMDETDDVCAVFSSINGKGKPLAQTDLLKNILMMRAGLPINEAYEKYWLPFEKGLSRAEVSSVLRKMVLAEHGWCNTSTTLDTLLRLPFAQNGKLAELHARMMGWKAQHQYVAANMPPKDFSRSTVSALKRIRLVAPLMQAQSLFLLEGLFLLNNRGALDEDNLRRALEIVENYVLRTCLFGNQTTRDACKVMSELLKKQHEEIPAALRRALWQDNKTYRDASDNRLQSHAQRLRMDTKLRRAWVKAVLMRIDGMQNVEVDYNDPSLEHVMPQSLEGARMWDSSVPADTPHYLGNLTILHRPYNSDLGRSSYSEKQSELARSIVSLNQYFAAVPAWTPVEVDERTAVLVRAFCQVVPAH